MRRPMRARSLVRAIAWALAALFSLRATAALAAFTPPVLAARPVVDAAGKLSADDVTAIEQRLMPTSPAAARRGAKADDGSRPLIIFATIMGVGMLIMLVGGILARRGGKGGTASRDGGGSDHAGSSSGSDGGESGGGGASGDY